MVARLSNEEYIKRINGYGKVKFVSCDDTEIKSVSMVLVKCNNGHEWKATAAQLCHVKTGCKICAGLAKKSEHEVINEINKIDGVSFIKFKSGSYQGAKSKVLCSCDKCGHTDEVIVDNLIRRKSFCRKCAGTFSYSKNEYIEKINSARSSVSFVSFDSEIVNQKTRVTLLCDCGHKWETSVQQAASGRAGCKKCSKCYQFDYSERESQINNLGGIRFKKWIDKRKKCNVDSRFIAGCDSCGSEWEISIDNAIRGKSCPNCAGYGFNKCLDGFVYMLKSNCGKHLKVGISNYPEKRIRQLEKATPFCFNVIGIAKMDGELCRSIESRFHKDYNSSLLSGFDGCTEWILFCDDAVNEFKKLGA